MLVGAAGRRSRLKPLLRGIWMLVGAAWRRSRLKPLLRGSWMLAGGARAWSRLKPLLQEDDLVLGDAGPQTERTRIAPGPLAGQALAFFALASLSQVSTTVSGLSETDSMPCSISHWARSGWSDGPWPQMPTYLPLARAVLIAIDSSFLTAGSRSSNSWATMPESRSRPRVSWVRSLEPIEKPSKISRNS